MMTQQKSLRSCGCITYNMDRGGFSTRRGSTIGLSRKRQKAKEAAARGSDDGEEVERTEFSDGCEVGGEGSWIPGGIG
jgi:hypothetical protein